MRFWDAVKTMYGPGHVVAAAEGGLALVAIRKEDVRGGLVCTGPCVNVLTRLAQAGNVYHETHETNERGEG